MLLAQLLSSWLVHKTIHHILLFRLGIITSGFLITTCSRKYRVSRERLALRSLGEVLGGPFGLRASSEEESSGSQKLQSVILQDQVLSL